MDDLLFQFMTEVVSTVPLVFFLIFSLRWLTAKYEERIDKLEQDISELRALLLEKSQDYEDELKSDKA